MSDLAAWLLAQIEEDERLANVAGRYVMEWKATEFEVGGGSYASVCESSDYGSDPLEHIARHDPARVLAECAAKRAIVARHSDGGCPVGWTKDVYGGVDHACLECGTFDEYGVAWPCPTLRILAQPYCDREGWRDEWATM